MRIFVDSADINDIKRLNDLGIVDGVTTNPSLVVKVGKNFKDIVREICEVVNGPVCAEVVSITYEGMIEEGIELAKIHENVVIKVPVTPAGIKAIQFFSQNEIKTNCTLIFSANQALLAAKAGATYVSPFVGRLDDNGQNGMELIAEIKTIYDNYGFETQIISASVRHAIHVKESALAGADIATCPPAVIDQLFKHGLTDSGLQKFLEDWKKIPEDLRKII
jgi:transaldolase